MTPPYFLPRGLAACVLTSGLAVAVDLNNDGLSDVWQQRFSAGNLQPEGDEDGDAYTNLEECAAGTDPFLATDYPRQEPITVGPGGQPLFISFPTQEGKRYQLSRSEALGNFIDVGTPLPGTGEMMELAVDDQTPSTVAGVVEHSLWANVTGVDLTSLTSLAAFPASPDGEIFLPEFEIEPALGVGFGGRLRAVIEAPASGQFIFSLTAAGPAELLLSSDESETNLVKIAELLPGQNDADPGVWNVYPNQQSAPLQLTEGSKYAIEVRYLAPVPQAHCEVGWLTPAGGNTTPLPGSIIVPKTFLEAPVVPAVVLNHDYDSEGQTGQLWPNNAAPATAPPGMSGLAESFLSSWPNASVPFSSTLDGDFYATFLFQMNTGHKQVILRFRDEDVVPPLRGPRIDVERDNADPSRAVIRAGRGGDQAEIEVTYGAVYRVEIVGTFSAEGFSYRTPAGMEVVPQKRFDLYVSDAAGNLIGSASDLLFRESETNQLTALEAHQLVFNPNAVFDDWYISAGSIPGAGYVETNLTGFLVGGGDQFFRVRIDDQDQDNDGLADWDEIQLSKHQPFLFFDAESVTGTSDSDALATVLQATAPRPIFSLQASDTVAFESNFPLGGEDHGEIIVTRSGGLAPVTLTLTRPPLTSTGNTATVCDGTCCTLIGSAGDEAVENNDYLITDEEGKIVTNTLSFGFGEMSRTLTVKAMPDERAEYPETLNLALGADPSYDLSELNGASIQIFDLPDHPDNVTAFQGSFVAEPGKSSNVSGFATAKLSGCRTQVLLSTGNITGPATFIQQDSHVHKSNASPSGELPGLIIFPIVDAQGEIINDPLTDHVWDLTASSGAVPTAGGAASKQVIIDSLFRENGESSLYINLHSTDFPDGEVWALFRQIDGSIEPPADPDPDLAPGSPGYPQLAGLELESEVRRFLNQATFGADDSEVNVIVQMIENERLADPDYHRAQAYTDWLDAQMALPQTYHLDYHLAATNQYYLLRGAYDPVRNPSDAEHNTPAVPTVWPAVDRSDPNPEHWYLDQPYPLIRRDLLLAARNGFGLKPPLDARRRVSWQMMINPRDQLRQKMGYALQQIVVVSAEAPFVRGQPYGVDNYQDQLNFHAFNHYRDILGFVNWSPIMAKWLSSLQNQKAADIDGDGENDVFPDENLARENMQLFSIGLFELWPDGTLALDGSGQIKPTYTNDDIREFARILTGQSFRHWESTGDPPRWGGVPFASIAENGTFNRRQDGDGFLNTHYSYPMKMFGSFHDTGVKSFAGTTIDNTALGSPDLIGIADIESAIDWLAGKPGDGQPDFDMVNSHRSTPAFISRRLIQRFTTSNPSREYLHRVATVFKESEGNLGLTIRAILLDSEARRVDLSDTIFGMKKSPLESFVQVVRSLQAISYLPITDPGAVAPYTELSGDFTNPQLYLDFYRYPASQIANHERNLRFPIANVITPLTVGLQINPMAQETVFNWYLPDYTPGGAIAAAGLVAPELQLANEPDIIRNINYLEQMARNENGAFTNALVDDVFRQRIAFGTPESDGSVDQHDRVRLDRDSIAQAFYPSMPPLPAGGRTSESLGDEALVDELDRRLTLGYLKRKYPYDPSDNEDPNGLPGNDLLKNPRELIIDALSFHPDPWDGNNDVTDRREKVGDAIFLITISPEFQIKK